MFNMKKASGLIAGPGKNCGYQIRITYSAFKDKYEVNMLHANAEWNFVVDKTKKRESFTTMEEVLKYLSNYEN